MNRLDRFGFGPDPIGQPRLEAPSLRLETLVLDVTPDLALAWLADARHCRPLCPRAVARFAQEMRAGRWALNGQTVVFDRQGRLRDGCRRLAGVVKAGVTVRMLIVRGVEPGSAETLDSGQPRGLGQLLRARGEARPGPLAAALRLFRRWLQSDDELPTVVPTPHGLITLLERVPELRASLLLIESQGWRGATLPVLAVAHLVLATEADPACVTAFFQRLGDPDLPRGEHPIPDLQRRLEARNGSSLSRLFLVLDGFDEWVARATRTRNA